MIKLHKSSLVLIFSLYLGSAYACIEGEKGCDVNKRDWAEVMKYHMPRSFCAIDSPLVKCTNITQKQCKKLVSKAVDICLGDNDKNIPQVLNKVEAGDWGEVIGDCGGKKIFNHIKFKEDKDMSCREYL